MSLDAISLRRALLRWYRAHKRDLPWRRTSDPYAILVSELMLQQTQVKTALPYYEKFLKAFPTPKALAKAPQEKVLAVWAGLGYYRRARFLQAAAQAITEAGSFPDTLEGLRALPGVGAYTAAAVGSIAFGLPTAVVDGNVIRVLSRLTALGVDPTKGAGAEAIRETAQSLIDERHPGDFNQAVMELGASLCSPSRPQCPACPLNKHCAAFLSGKAEAYPRLPARAATQSVYKAVVLAVQGKGPQAKLLMKERQATRRLEGFWSLPELELEMDDKEEAEKAALKEAKRLLGKSAALAGRLNKHRHSITVYDIHLYPFWFTAPVAEPKGGWQWVSFGKAAKLPLASAEKKLMQQLRKMLAPGAEEAGQLGLKL